MQCLCVQVALVCLRQSGIKMMSQQNAIQEIMISSPATLHRLTVPCTNFNIRRIAGAMSPNLG